MNWGTLVVTLITSNGNETVVTPILVSDGTNYTGFTYSPPSDLATGLHSVRVSVSDNAGYPTEIEWPFTCATDATAPSITNLRPAPNSTVYVPFPLIAADIADSESGIDFTIPTLCRYERG